MAADNTSVEYLVNFLETGRGFEGSVVELEDEPTGESERVEEDVEG